MTDGRPSVPSQLIRYRVRMTVVRNPGLAPDSAPQRLYENLRDGVTLVWYAADANDGAILSYVTRLLGFSRADMLVSSFGYGIAPDESVMVVRLRGSHGSAVCAKPVISVGIERVNRGLETEHEETMSALSGGEFTGNLAEEGHAKHAAILNGAIHPDFEGSDVLNFIHDADVIHITGIGFADE